MKQIKTLKILYCIVNLFIMLLGSLLLFLPSSMTQNYVRICGCLLVVFGIIKLFSSASDDQLQIAFQFDFTIGILLLIVGIFSLIHDGMMGNMFLFALTILMILNAILKIRSSLEAKKIGIPIWWASLSLSIVIILMSATLLFDMELEFTSIFKLSAVLMLLTGFLDTFIVLETVNTP